MGEVFYGMETLTLWAQQTLKLLEEAEGVGITSKQIANKLKLNEEEIMDSIQELQEKGKITKKGRGLWIAKKFEDLATISDFRTPESYIEEFKKKYKVTLKKDYQDINFSPNLNKPVHRWAQYIQGFSANFADSILDRYGMKEGDTVLDPMAGSGTVSVCAKERGVNSIGVEMLPIMAFAMNVKTKWDIDIRSVKEEFNDLISAWNKSRGNLEFPHFLRTENHFERKVLDDLLKLKEAILSIDNSDVKNLFKLAFLSILVPCSNLKRSPCLGYERKSTSDNTVFLHFKQKINEIVEDLEYVQSLKKWGVSKTILGNAKEISYDWPIDLAITSPPYMSGLDYVINYKVEMAWLDFVKEYKDLTKLKNEMIACDNVGREVTRTFSKRSSFYSNEWLNEIVKDISRKIKIKGNYRRDDMHLIVQKYFDDLFPIFNNVYKGLKKGGRFIIVIGDSLIASIYVPTDLLLAKMGEEIGFEIEEIRIARGRRSGQRTDFKLREDIVTLRK